MENELKELKWTTTKDGLGIEILGFRDGFAPRRPIAVNVPTRIDGKQVVRIGEFAFKGRCDVAEIVLPDGLTEIGGGAFGYCFRLRSARLPASVAKIGVGAFSGCTALQSLKLPEGLRAIGWRAFYNCCSLVAVALPERLAEIAQLAFDPATILRARKGSAAERRARELGYRCEELEGV